MLLSVHSGLVLPQKNAIDAQLGFRKFHHADKQQLAILHRADELGKKGLPRGCLKSQSKMSNNATHQLKQFFRT